VAFFGKQRSRVKRVDFVEIRAGLESGHAAHPWRYATLVERSLRVRRRTRIPSRASMSMSVSVLKRSIRPLSRSLTLGCVTCRILAACDCFRPRSLRAFSIWIMRSARIRRCADCSGPKPRSRKTLPLERDTLDLRFATFFSPSFLQEFSISVPRLLDVSFRGLLGAFFEGVEDINTLCEARDVEDPMFGGRVNPNLLDARTHRRYPLPVVRQESLLDPTKLEADTPSSWGWKGSDFVQRGPQPKERLIHSVRVYKY
jgi:hypothetical protein